MAWEYRRGPGPTIQHTAGTIPPRPLTVGDEVVWESGHIDTVVGTSATLLLFDSRWQAPMFRRPIEGDDLASVLVRTPRHAIEGDFTQVAT